MKKHAFGVLFFAQQTDLLFHNVPKEVQYKHLFLRTYVCKKTEKMGARGQITKVS